MMTDSEQKARDISVSLAVFDTLSGLGILIVFVYFIILARDLGGIFDWILLFLMFCLLMFAAIIESKEVHFRNKKLSMMWEEVHGAKQRTLRIDLIENIQILHALGEGNFGEVNHRISKSLFLNFSLNSGIERNV